MGYSGGKLLPKEKDRISGIVAEKSLHTFVAIKILPSWSALNVFQNNNNEKINSAEKRRISNLFCFTNARRFFIGKVYQQISKVCKKTITTKQELMRTISKLYRRVLQLW